MSTVHYTVQQIDLAHIFAIPSIPPSSIPSQIPNVTKTVALPITGSRSRVFSQPKMDALIYESSCCAQCRLFHFRTIHFPPLYIHRIMPASPCIFSHTMRKQLQTVLLERSDRGLSERVIRMVCCTGINKERRTALRKRMCAVVPNLQDILMSSL